MTGIYRTVERLVIKSFFLLAAVAYFGETIAYALAK